MTRVFADEQLAAHVSRPAPAFAELDVAAIRAGIAARARSRPRGPELASVRDVADGPVPMRLFRPTDDAVPLIVQLHGGGFCVGDLDSYDRVCRRLAATSGAAVLAVGYRLAPENPWPASVDDTVAALRWVADRPSVLGPLDGSVAVLGDSAGGTLAALACLRLRDETPDAQPDLQVLLYPNTDLTCAQPSMRAGDGAGMSLESEQFFARQWVPDEAQWADPGVSPLFAAPSKDLPPALIVSAEHDILRDDATAYADRLREAGVDVELRCEPGLVHNFLQLDEISPACAAAADRVASEVAERLRAA